MSGLRMRLYRADAHERLSVLLRMSTLQDVAASSSGGLLRILFLWVHAMPIQTGSRRAELELLQLINRSYAESGRHCSRPDPAGVPFVA
jgi:hypothetical protein